MHLTPSPTHACRCRSQERTGERGDRWRDREKHIERGRDRQRERGEGERKRER